MACNLHGWDRRSTLGPLPLADGSWAISVTPASAIIARSFFCSAETWRAFAKILQAARPSQKPRLEGVHGVMICEYGLLPHQAWKTVMSWMRVVITA